MPTPATPGKAESDHGAIHLSRHVTIAVVAPVVLLLALGLVFARQITKLVESSRWVSHTNEVLSKIYDTRVRILDMETSLRAYLLSGDRTMLDGLEQSSPEVAVDAVLDLTRDNAAQQLRMHDVAATVKTWETRAQAATIGDAKLARDDMDALRVRRSLLLHAGDLLDAGAQQEQSLLMDRKNANDELAYSSKLLLLGLLVLSAGAIALISRRELGAVSRAFRAVVAEERAARATSSDREWIRRGEATVTTELVGELDVVQVSSAALRALVQHTGALVGAVYQVRGPALVRTAALGVPGGRAAEQPIADGQLGQVLADNAPRRIVDATAQLEVGGTTAVARTVELVLAPVAIDSRVIGVFELGFKSAVEPRVLELLRSVSLPTAVALRGAEQRQRLQELLEQTQHQGEELQTQHEELRVTNEELEHQSTALREAGVRRQQVQHELEATNANLEEQTGILEQQRAELIRSEAALQERARELLQASEYKSEFLARMSHELRTPLNSSLILARLLGDNPSGNLSVEQVKFANTIYSAGNDLLLLINDILDLAKIEAGRLELRVAPVQLARVKDTLVREFEPVAKAKGIGLRVDVDSNVPASIMSDEQRLVQVMRNLISNACKFTDRGEVTVRFSTDGTNLRASVRDTGIGIPKEHLERVFDAFHQVDGGASRKHGGTGLGLAISRDLAHLLGGELELESTPGEGSMFALSMPLEPPAASVHAASSVPVLARAEAAPMTRQPRMSRPSSVQPRPTPSPGRATLPPSNPGSSKSPAPVANGVADDREHLDRSKRLLLVIEDDLAFAGILVDLAHELGFQTLHSSLADDGVALALQYVPDGIWLDVNLPDRSGLSVLERIKRQPSLRHVPIHMGSGEDHTKRALELGAIGYLMKPASRDELAAAIRRIEDRTSQRVRRLLIVEDDEVQADALSHLLAAGDLEITKVDSVEGTLAHLATTSFDCVVMDLRLTDGTGFELLAKMSSDDRITFPPVIVHTGKALTAEEEAQLQSYSSSIIVKGARSPERLLDEVALFMHQVEADMPPERQRMLREVRNREQVFEGRRVLVVEDDVRNIFALTSILEPRGLTVTIARNGREALEMLDKHRIDLILMDIMMPEMDGLEATRRIRQRADGKLPIIALTAKAMADDRAASLEAGANDYLAKPIDIDMLLSLLRVWMPR